jgi:uncharacterized membrane-anchored protein
MTTSPGILLVAALLFLPATIQAAENPGAAVAEQADPMAALLRQFQWIKGPGTAAISQLAEIQVPSGFIFTGAEGAQGMLQAWGNPTDGEELALLGPAGLDWSVIFEFDDVGYVKDEEKTQLNPDKLLKSIREGSERANKLRKEMGSPPLHVTGWQQPPTYNTDTHNLEWAIRGESEGRTIVNYNTRLLGRNGVMSVTLLVEPDRLLEVLPAYQSLLRSYSFQDGQSYAEYRPGDKIAQYGLTALIVGGAAAGAAKLGLFAWLAIAFKKFWKLIVVGVVAILASVRRLLFGPSGRTEPRL